MKNYSKVGKRTGRPAYRTPSSFRYKKYVQVRAISLPNKKSRGFTGNTA